MKVLHVIPSVAPRYGGPSRAIFEMCRASQKREAEVLIATTDADGQGRLPVELGTPLSYQGIQTIFFPRQWSEAFKYSYPLSRWLEANVKNFDVVHIHAVFSHACLSAAKACRKQGVPYIVRPLGTLDPWSMSQKSYRKRLMWRLAGARMLSAASAVHYTTSEERRLAERSLGLNHGVVIPLGVEVEKLQDYSVNGIFRKRHPSLGLNPYVLVMSRIHPKKNLELLIEAFLSLVKKPGFKNWWLVLAGGGETEYINSLRHLVEAREGENNVLLTGWLDGAEKISALQNAALLALTSYQENFGICVVEALACGVPVLISEHVNLASEVETARAGWVTSLERDDLSHVLAEALGSDNERKRRGAVGPHLVDSKFSWNNSAGELAVLYQAIAAR